MYGEAVTHYKIGDFKQSKKCVKIAIKNYKVDSLQDPNEMLYFKAMCYKHLEKYSKACRDYGALSAIFKENEKSNMLKHITKLLLIINDENKFNQDLTIKDTIDLVHTFCPCEPKDKDQLLSRYTDPETGMLNMEKYGLMIIQALKKVPFFNRFGIEHLKKYLSRGVVQYFNHDDIIFLKGQVGVITHGSVRVRSHMGKNMMTPKTIGRYRVGRILGHGASDNNNTIRSNTWFSSFDNSTEILFLPLDDFDNLWKCHNDKTHYILMANALINNSFFRHLSQQTVYHIVFDVMQIKKYRPG